MQSSDAAVSAVLATLIRATVDHQVPVVLRTRRASQATELAHWLACVHGSARIVVPSVALRGEIEVRLPRQMVWPPVPDRGVGGPPLALREVESHLSAMSAPPPSAGIP